MDFNLIKQCNKKLNIWTGSISFSFLMVTLVIIFVLNTIDLKIRAFIGIQFFINNLLVWLLIVFVNSSPLIIKELFRMTNYYHPQTKSLEKSEFTLAKLTHFFIFLFALVIFLIEITSSMFLNQDWISAFKNNWWICFIIMIFNISFSYTNFLIAKFLYNRQNDKY